MTILEMYQELEEQTQEEYDFYDDNLEYTLEIDYTTQQQYSQWTVIVLSTTT